jgi:uncharacterized protein
MSPGFGVPSRYNFVVPVGDQTLLFNALSGALISLRGIDGRGVGAALTGEGDLAIEDIPEDLARDFLEKGFLTLDGRAQFEEVRERFRNARLSTPMVLTVTTTLDCNLGCYYCYQDRSTEQLAGSDVGQIVDNTKQRLLESGRKRLHVDWYGGEPLSNSDFIEACSIALQAMCHDLDVIYQASIISNGTLWPDDVGAFVARHAIVQVQISFDGMSVRHDKVRRFRSRSDQQLGMSSFGLASGLIDRLAHFVRVDARFNLDRTNAAELLSFVEDARERGWFDKPYPVVIQPARVSDYSERSSFLKSHKLSLAEFDQIRAELRVASRAGSGFSIEESEAPAGYPYPKTSVCAALVDDSSVFGADGRVYRCGLQVSEPHRAVGNFRANRSLGRPAHERIIPIISQIDVVAAAQASWWQSFDPCEQPTCSVCSFLPICMGGCPKKHLEGDRESLDEQGAYWRHNLARLLVNAAQPGSSSDFQIPITHQFRQ